MRVGRNEESLAKVGTRAERTSSHVTLGLDACFEGRTSDSQKLNGPEMQQTMQQTHFQNETCHKRPDIRTLFRALQHEVIPLLPFCR